MLRQVETVVLKLGHHAQDVVVLMPVAHQAQHGMVVLKAATLFDFVVVTLASLQAQMAVRVVPHALLLVELQTQREQTVEVTGAYGVQAPLFQPSSARCPYPAPPPPTLQLHLAAPSLRALRGRLRPRCRTTKQHHDRLPWPLHVV